MPEEPVQCPIECPNRKSGDATVDRYRERGRWGAYVFGLIVMLLAVAFSVERKPDGVWEPKNDPPVLVWGLLFPIAASCLGVPIDAETIGRVISKVLPTKDD